MPYELEGQFTVVGPSSTEARKLCSEVLGPAADRIASEPFLQSGAESVDRENIIVYVDEQAICLRFYAARVETEDGEEPHAKYSISTTDQRCWRPGDYWPEEEIATDQELEDMFGQQLIEELRETAKTVKSEEVDSEQPPEVRYVQTLSKFEIDERDLVPCRTAQMVFYDSSMRIVATREFDNSSTSGSDQQHDDGLDELESHFSDVFLEADVSEIHSVLGRLGLLTVV